MAQSKEFFTRIQHKHDIEANWIKAINFVPLNGEIIVYDKDSEHDYARIKIGDGITKINELPFMLTDTYVPIKRSYVGQSSSTTTNPWYKFGYCKLDSGTFLDRTISFKVSQGFGDNTTRNGILTAHIRTGALGVVQNAQLVWEYANSGINTANFVLAYKVTADTCVEVELWAKQDVAYAKYHFEVISEHCRNEWTNDWTLYTADTAGQAASITDGWTQVVSQCATLNNPISAMGGCWISFTDENGNPTNEPFIHFVVDENGNPVYNSEISLAEDGEF